MEWFQSFRRKTAPQFYEISFFDFVHMYVFFFHYDLVKLQGAVAGSSLQKIEN